MQQTDRLTLEAERPEQGGAASQRFDTFMCVHKRDVDTVFGLALRSWELNFAPKGRLSIVTNDLPYMRDFIDRMGLAVQPALYADHEWLSKAEAGLPGWFKQQVIKLRAPQFCQSAAFCNLGADTLLLQPIDRADLIDGGEPVLYYTRHRLPDKHYLYERQRVGHIGRILQVEPTNARRYTDFINDLFCFSRASLLSLTAYLEKRYGPDCYAAILRGLDSHSERDRSQFGEWTLYSTYLLDVLHQTPTIRNTRDGYLHQVHSQRGLRGYRFDTKIVHLVGKDLDFELVRRKLEARQPALLQNLSFDALS